MIILTGAAGFIGSCMLSKMNIKGVENIIIVDDFSKPEKNKNFEGKKYIKQIHREDFIDWFKTNYKNVDFVIHIGARTDTAEFDMKVFDKLNINYSKDIWNICTEHEIPLIYASSQQHTVWASTAITTITMWLQSSSL